MKALLLLALFACSDDRARRAAERQQAERAEIVQLAQYCDLSGVNGQLAMGLSHMPEYIANDRKRGTEVLSTMITDLISTRLGGCEVAAKNAASFLRDVPDDEIVRKAGERAQRAVELLTPADHALAELKLAMPSAPAEVVLARLAAFGQSTRRFDEPAN